MKRFTVMGFTEAELGFVIAALFAAIAAASLSAIGESRELKEKIEQLEAQNRNLSDDVTRLERANKQLREENEELRKKTSRKTPNCSERGRSDEPLGHVTILPDGSYLVGESVLSLEGVHDQFREELSFSDEYTCRFTLGVRATPGADAVVFASARRQLARRFDLREESR